VRIAMLVSVSASRALVDERPLGWTWSMAQLLRSKGWVTDAELLPLLMRELGFQRRGAKIVARVEAAMRA
jgi:hypothetical protein